MPTKIHYKQYGLQAQLAKPQKLTYYTHKPQKHNKLTHKPHTHKFTISKPQYT